ncbi:MAG: sel1 repeat family protein [Gammaproteobacteria bacterium]|nr:sel1 repeat family protein [Gammaproteobacteria bacterium]NKB64009.1 sel1 repeat family protein [Gammaproteobacteria bacterium]
MSVEKNNNDSVSLASGIAAFEAKNFAQSLGLLGPLADQGNVDAQYRLAIMYQNGLGVVRNELLATKWMIAAANQGFSLAQHGLGFMYMEGDCVAKNGAKAVSWFKKASDQGLVGSQTTLAMMYEVGNGVEQNMEEAKKWYRLAGFNEDEMNLGTQLS